jgi:cytoskeleton protein RodZ
MLIVAALVVAVVGVNRDTSHADSPVVPVTRADESPGLDETADSRDGAVPVATSGQTIAGPAVSASHLTAMRFDLEANAECWVEAVVDGERLVYRLMRAGDRETIESGGDIVLRVGNPGALTYSLNGSRGEPLGKAGIPVTVRFTNQGERVQLAS